MTTQTPARERALRLAVTPLRDVVVRDATGTGDGSWTIEGYAAVFEQETTLWDLPGWFRVREEIARGAFGAVLDRLAHGDGLVHLNHGHDMTKVMAATDVDGIGRLDLAEDFHGLRFFARVDQEDPDAKALAVKMGRSVIRQASFAFTIAAQELVETTVLEDGTRDELWRIIEVAELYDVTVCAQGAYAMTESHLRSLAAASLRVPDLGTLGRFGLSGPGGRDRRAGEDPAGEEHRSDGVADVGSGGVVDVASAADLAGPEGAGEEVVRKACWARRRAALRARALELTALNPRQRKAPR